MLPVSSRINWYLTVILTLRTWAVWNRNQILSIVFPILYSLCWGSGLIMTVQFIKSFTCKWNLHAHFWWMIYFLLVGAPPYPGFNECFLTQASQDMAILWVLLVVWDAGRYKYIVICCSSDWKGSIVDAHAGTCYPRMWANQVLKISSTHLIFLILDRKGGNTSLTTMVYRDGKSLLFWQWQSRWIWT